MNIWNRTIDTPSKLTILVISTPTFVFMSVEVLDGREYDCLHAFGFEVYGKVYEEWGDQSGGDTGRIEKLEAQIDELEAQNDKLQAHNKALESRVEYLERKCEGA